MHEACGDARVVRECRCEVTDEGQHFLRLLDRVCHETAIDCLERMEPVLERGGDAEVAAASAKRPHQIGVRLFRDVEDVARRRYELDPVQIVRCEPDLAHEPAETSTKREAGDSRRRDQASRGGEPVECGLTIELAPDYPGLRVERSRARVDADPLHRGEVDHEAPLGDRAAGDIVTAPSHGDLETALAREANRIDYVGSAVAARD